MSISRMESGEIALCNECGGKSIKAFTSTSFEMLSPEALGRHKAPGDFRNLLTRMKKAHPGSVIRDH